MPYVCYEPHQEDLTDSVRRLVSSTPIRVARAVTRDDSAREHVAGRTDHPWKVHVTCSQGHENIFGGSGALDAKNTVVGRPPTEADKALKAAIAELLPVKSLDRLESFGKYLIGNASLAGVLLTGFGAWSPLADASVGWLLALPVGLFAASLALAVSALTPRPSSLNVHDLNDVENLLDGLIKTRSRLTRASGWLFAAGLFAAPFVMLAARSGGEARTDVSLTATGGGNITVAGTANVSRVPRGQQVEVHVHGMSGAGAAPLQTLLFGARQYADGKGQVTVTFSVPNLAVGTFTSFRAAVSAGCGRNKEVTIDAPPSAPAKSGPSAATQPKETVPQAPCTAPLLYNEVQEGLANGQTEKGTKEIEAGGIAAARESGLDEGDRKTRREGRLGGSVHQTDRALP